MSGRRAPVVEFLWWRGCPSWERALSDLHTQMEARGLDPVAVAVREVETDAEAQDEQFVGSPTIRIDGVDIQPPGDQPAGLTCRIYKLRDGRISALPDAAEVGAALERSIDKE